jgi:hypothetical protein
MSIRCSYSPDALPSYAQPTVSSAKHAFPKKDQVPRNTLKAGSGRSSARASRPSSSKQLTPKKITGINGPAFLQIFKSPTAQDTFESGYGSVRSKSSTYRSPKLVEKSVDNLYLSPQRYITKPLSALISETEVLLDQISKDHESFTDFDTEELYALGQRKRDLTTENWNKLVGYHSKIMKRVQEKIQTHHKLIQNVLELNNAITVAMKSLETEHEVLIKKNEDLQARYNDVLDNREIVGYIDTPQSIAEEAEDSSVKITTTDLVGISPILTSKRGLLDQGTCTKILSSYPDLDSMD